MEFNLQQLLERLQTVMSVKELRQKSQSPHFGSSALETISAFSNEPI